MYAHQFYPPGYAVSPLSGGMSVGQGGLVFVKIALAIA